MLQHKMKRLWKHHVCFKMQKIQLIHGLALHQERDIFQMLKSCFHLRNKNPMEQETH